MSILQKLSTLPIFADLDEQELRTLAGVAKPVKFDLGDDICKEGAPAMSAYVVLNGQVAVYKNNPRRRVAVLEAGALFGQIALIDGGRRTATCCPNVGEVGVVEISRDDFEILYRANNAFAYKVLDRVAVEMVELLRQVTRDLERIQTGEGRQEAARSEAEDLAELLGGYVDRTDFSKINLDDVEVVIPEGMQGKGYKRY